MSFGRRRRRRRTGCHGPAAATAVVSRERAIGFSGSAVWGWGFRGWWDALAGLHNLLCLAGFQGAQGEWALAAFHSNPLPWILGSVAGLLQGLLQASNAWRLHSLQSLGPAGS